jgi:hypothetical protein
MSTDNVTPIRPRQTELRKQQQAAALRRTLLDALDCLECSADYRQQMLEVTTDMNADELRQVLAALKETLIDIRRSRLRLVMESTRT